MEMADIEKAAALLNKRMKLSVMRFVVASEPEEGQTIHVEFEGHAFDFAALLLRDHVSSAIEAELLLNKKQLADIGVTIK